MEEKSYKLTNAFTTADEGSVLDISKRYRHLQHNKRSAAVRAIKKSCGIDAREHICHQIMVCEGYDCSHACVSMEIVKILMNTCFLRLNYKTLCVPM